MSPPARASARHLLVTNDFPPKVGGIQAYLWELWRRLDPARFVVLTACSDPGAPEFDAAQSPHGVRIERVPGRTLYLPTPSVRQRVRALAEETGASLVVFDPVLPLGLLGPQLGLAYGVVLHGAEAVIPSRLPGSRGLLERVLLGASLVVSAGRYPAEVMSPMVGGGGPGPSRPLHVEVPPGVDCTRFGPLGAAARGAVRRRLGLADAGPLVVSVSRLVPRKGMDVLVEAVRRLAPSFPDMTLAVAGTGRDEARLVAQARQTGSPVRFLGEVSEEDKVALLGCADVFAMACRSRWGGLEQEGFGIVFLEAAASGAPQVAGESGGAAEAVDHGRTGFVVRHPERVADVAAALRRLLADDALRRAMGDAARRRACAQFDYGLLVGKLAAALDEVQG